MSLFNDERYTWRETYFVLFDPEHRPRTTAMRRELRKAVGTFKILDEKTDSDGNLLSLTIASYEDHSALEIVYQEGEGVLTETEVLIRALGKTSSSREKLRLERVGRCRARFDVLHFEQTAGTAAFKIVKLPELRFSHPEKNGTQPPSRATRFHFDPNSLENCRIGNPAERDGESDNDPDEDDVGMDSGILERVDPNTLVLVLEMLCRLSGGVAIDPASGVVI